MAMLGTGMAAQLAALPTELDASFRRAMPLLRNDYLDAQQSEDAKKILVASSLTYVASSLLAVMNIWPWLPRSGPTRLPARLSLQNSLDEHPAQTDDRFNNIVIEQSGRRNLDVQRRPHNQTQAGMLPALVRIISKPLVRSWFRLRWGL